MRLYNEQNNKTITIWEWIPWWLFWAFIIKEKIGVSNSIRVWLVGEILSKMAKNCMKITKSIFFGQNNRGPWGDWPVGGWGMFPCPSCLRVHNWLRWWKWNSLNKKFNYVLIGIHSMQGWTSTTRHEVPRERRKRRKAYRTAVWKKHKD